MKMTDEDRRRIRNLRRQVSRARHFPTNTCGASRHVAMMADILLRNGHAHMIAEEPAHCAESMLATVAALWQARTLIAKLQGPEVTARKLQRAIDRVSALTVGET